MKTKTKTALSGLSYYVESWQHDGQRMIQFVRRLDPGEEKSIDESTRARAYSFDILLSRLRASLADVDSGGWVIDHDTALALLESLPNTSQQRLEQNHAELVREIETDVSAIEHILAPMLYHGSEPKDKALQALAAEILRRVHRADHNGRRACILGRRIAADEARKEAQVLTTNGR